MVLGVFVLAGVAICQTKALRVPEPARRLALVIGNAEYAENGLANPEGDARLIETTLKGLGFDDVVLETNLETLRPLGGGGAGIRTGECSRRLCYAAAVGRRLLAIKQLTRNPLIDSRSNADGLNGEHESDSHNQSQRSPMWHLGLTKVVGSSYAEAASVCLDDQGHSSPKPMDIIEPEGKETVTINWDPLPARAKGSWDLVDATEHGPTESLL